jgi:phage nucleotide-binding protein
MKITNTSDPTIQPPINMIVYGDGGVGKTTFAVTAPKPLLLDLEGGAKYFGLRGIKLDTATIESWSETDEFIKYAMTNKFETIVVDPIGELMALLRRYMESLKDSKLNQRDGSPTAAGWGYLKQNMRTFLRKIRDVGIHAIVVAHVDDVNDDGKIIKYPMIETKIRQEMINMFDVVGYMTVAGAGESAKRVILVDPESDKYKTKDRTGQLGKIIEPDFSKIVKACQGTGTFSWMKETAKKPVIEVKKEAVVDTSKLEQANAKV